MQNKQLEQIINQKLHCDLYQDYAPNGLQIEGKSTIKKIVTGVSACQRLLDRAVAEQADAVLVHHGYFWKNEPMIITGIKYQRIKTLIQHNINLFSYHLPLDGHNELGNNAQLGQLLAINIDERSDMTDLLFTGRFSSAISAQTLLARIQTVINPNVLFCGDSGPKMINRIAWCSGGAQDYIEQAALQGCDAFITGEVSERTIHMAREYGIHFYAAGHHATERYGIKALGEWLAQHYAVDVNFIDIDNPA